MCGVVVAGSWFYYLRNYGLVVCKIWFGLILNLRGLIRVLYIDVLSAHSYLQIFTISVHQSLAKSHHTPVPWNFPTHQKVLQVNYYNDLFQKNYCFIIIKMGHVEFYAI